MRLPVVDGVADEHTLDERQIEHTHDAVQAHVVRVDRLEQHFVGVEARVEVRRYAGLLEHAPPCEDQVVADERRVTVNARRRSLGC